MVHSGWLSCLRSCLRHPLVLLMLRLLQVGETIAAAPLMPLALALLMQLALPPLPTAPACLTLRLLHRQLLLQRAPLLRLCCRLPCCINNSQGLERTRAL